MQFSLMVTLYDSLIIVLPALTLARSYILQNAITETKAKRILLIWSLSWDNVLTHYDLQTWS